MIIINIVGFSLAWLLIGLLTTVFTSNPPKTGHINIDGGYNYEVDYDNYYYNYRFIFSVVLWPVALAIRVIKFIIYFLPVLWAGFKEELKHK